MRKYFTYLLCSLLALQAIPSAIAQVNVVTDSVAQRYAQQYKAYYDALLDDTSDVAAMLDLAAFYSQPDNPMHSYSLAMKYANNAEVTYRRLITSGENHRNVTRLIRKGITIEVAQRMRERTMLAASKYIVVAKGIDEAELDDMARSCGTSPAMQRLVDKKRTLISFEQAQKENTLDAYNNFVKRFPNTVEAYDANVMMGHLATALFRKATDHHEVDLLAEPYIATPNVARAARERKSALSFDTVKSIGTPQAYYDYLKKYPYTSQYVKALDAVDRELLRQLKDINVPQQLVDFVHQNEASVVSDSAMRKLRQMIILDHNIEAAQAYFQNFPHDREYMGLYQIYYEWYANEGNRDPLENFARRNPRFPYQGELLSDLRLSTTVDSMDLMKPFRESEYVKYLNYVLAVGGKDITYVAMLRTLQPAIAAKNWNAVVQRMADFAPTFELYSTDLLQSLYALIDEPVNPAKTIASECSPDYNMLNPAITDNGAYLYYNRNDVQGSRVHVAQHVTGKRYRWVSIGDVEFVNAESDDITFYNLFDNDHRMLVSYSGELWIAVEEGPRSWRLEEKLPSPVNSGYHDVDAFMLRDGSGILLASDRLGGMNVQNSGAYFHGDTALATDLYYIPRTEVGWGKAINLGVGVNSSYSERHPVLSNDLKTLYFITDGRAGMGYGDIYYATRKNIDDWTGWSDAHNYGKEVNSGFNEASLSLTADGSKLVFSSNYSGIYHCYTVAATVTAVADGTQGTGQPAVLTTIGSSKPAVLRVVDPGTHYTVKESNAAGEAVSTMLYPAKEYLVMPQDYVSFQSFIPSVIVNGTDRTVMLKAYYPATFRNADSVLQNSPVADLPLPALRFEKDATTLTPEGEAEMDNIVNFLQVNNDVRADFAINVKGQDDVHCFELGRQRCMVLMHKMKEKGVNQRIISFSNYGNSNSSKDATTSEITVTLSIIN